MPNEWQSEFVALLEELDETIDWRPKEGRYWVQLKDKRGRYVADPLMDYEEKRKATPGTKERIITMPTPKPLVQLHAKVGRKLAEIEPSLSALASPCPTLRFLPEIPPTTR